MRFQPENLVECLHIECKRCLISNPKICLQTSQINMFELMDIKLRNQIKKNYSDNSGRV